MGADWHSFVNAFSSLICLVLDCLCFHSMTVWLSRLSCPWWLLSESLINLFIFYHCEEFWKTWESDYLFFLIVIRLTSLNLAVHSCWSY